MKQESRSLLLDLPTKAGKPSKRELIGEGDGKSFYHSEKPDLIIQEFRSLQFEEKKKYSKAKDLSSLRNEISSYLFGYVEGFHIPTHFVSKLSSTAMVVRRAEMIPLNLRIYNSCPEPMLKRFGLLEGTSLDFPILEHFYRNGRRAPSWMNEYHMYALNIVTPDELIQINRLASKVNAVLRGLCDRRKLFIADLQLAFGRFKDQIILGDELSPVTCHFIDVANDGKREQDRFSPDQENSVEAFSELYQRLKLKA